ncbi:MAG: DsbA family protein [Acetobacter sp.]|nr:DsbA family protein [Acetobacter sp.]
MLIIRRISKILATIIIYVVCAYGYLTAKGFILTENGMILSNQAHAQESEFAQKVEGDIDIDNTRMRIKGNADAPLTMYSYSSMACSHCREFHKFILPKIERDFISTGKLNFIYVHFPIDVRSMKIAKLSYCLPAEKYYDFISELYDKKDWQFSEDENILNEYARKYGMTDEELEKCNQNTKLTSDILLTRNTAIEKFGIKGTPSFIIAGKTSKELIVGARSYDDIKEYLNSRLEEDK